jgi:hypothetical protein
MLATRDVQVSVRNNSSAAWVLGSFNFNIVDPDSTRLVAPKLGELLDANPDFNADTTGLQDWACGPGGPDNDVDDNAANGYDSFISCFNGSGSGPSIAAGGVGPLALVHYSIPAGADPGSVFLSTHDVGVFDSNFFGRGGCNPDTPEALAAHCAGAEIILYCPIDQADINNDGKVNSGDQLLLAFQYGVVPAPPTHDQNFDGVINSGDQLAIAQVFNRLVSECP